MPSAHRVEEIDETKIGSNLQAAAQVQVEEEKAVRQARGLDQERDSSMVGTTNASTAAPTNIGGTSAALLKR